MINIRMQQTKDVHKLSPKITVIGVGGAGGNAVNNMISAGLQGVEFLVCNTDAQALESSLCEHKLQLGTQTTGGLGAGAKPDVGRAAAEESLNDVLRYLEGANMAFITAGMGGGTGTGAAPVIARACREKGILTVGVVTKPFHFEGTLRMKMAEAGIAQMQDYVDTLLVIPNQNLFRVANEKTTFADAFRMADSVLQSGVRGVTDLMVMPGLINLDFADIRSAMLEMGKAMMGTGEATGDRRAIEAAEKAINNPLLDDVSVKGARGVIINVTGGYDMTLFEVDEACNRIRDEVDPNANIIFGSTFHESMEGTMRVSIVATGIDAAEAKLRKPVSAGGFSLNAQTVQQQRIERVQPQAESMSAAWQAAPAAAYRAPVQAPVSAPVAPVQQPLNLRPAVPAQPVATVDVDSLPEWAVQPETAVISEPVYVDQSAPMASAPVQAPVATAGLSASPRGAVYGNAFIPPRPVEPDTRPADEAAAYAASTFGAGLAARRPVPAQGEPVAPATGYTLKPPVPGQNAQQKRRTPSLFERLTAPRRQPEAEDDGITGPAVATAPQRTVQQGMLNIDAPKGDVSDDELDIPAFLRRQAN